MFCRNCGNQLAESAVVCPKCGVPVPGKSFANVKVPNHMVGAIVTALFCLIPGVIAIVYASKVNSRLASGDVEGALAASNVANRWITVGAVLAVGIIILSVIGNSI